LKFFSETHSQLLTLLFLSALNLSLATTLNLSLRRPGIVASKERSAKKGISFEIDKATVTMVDGDSSVLSSVTTLSAHGTRDLHKVVEEIQDEFVMTSNFGKEVVLLLEVCKRPYRYRVAALRGMNECSVFFCKMLEL